MKIGIAALGSGRGSAGGVDVYTRDLVEAAARFGGEHEFVVFPDAETLSTWLDREWPRHVGFVPLRGMTRTSDLPARVWRKTRRLFGANAPAVTGDDYLAGQIDRRGLDAVIFPRTTLCPLGVCTPSVLVFQDMQHEFYPEYFTAEEVRRRDRIYRASVERASGIVVPSEFTNRCLVEKYAVSPGKVRVIPLGVSDRFRPPTPDEVAGIRAKYRLPDVFMLYPANPWPHKNHARLLAALRLLGERHGTPPFLVLTGRLRRDDTSVMAIEDYGRVRDHVKDLGLVPRGDMPALYGAATAMVFPSLFEGFGLPLVEAVACGCPVVASNATSIPEVLGHAGEYFDPLRSEDIAAALDRMIGEPAARRARAARGMDRVKRYSWSNVLPEIVMAAQGVTRSSERMPR